MHPCPLVILALLVLISATTAGAQELLPRRDVFVRPGGDRKSVV